MLALLPTLFTFLVAVAPPVTPATITPAEAAQHVGKEVVVRGKVEQVVTAVSLTVHVNFGGKFPNQVFTVKIFRASSQGVFPDVESYEGQVIELQGVVRMYKGNPEIEVREPTQLRRVAEPAPSS